MALNVKIGIAGLFCAAVLAGTRRRDNWVEAGSTRPMPTPQPNPAPNPVFVPTVPAVVPAVFTVPPGAAGFPGNAGLPSVVGRVIAAAATQNPDLMRAEAAKLRAEGWPDQAADLEELARRTEQLRAATTPPKPPAPAPVKPPAPAAPVITDPMTGQVIPQTQWPVPAPAPAPVKPPTPSPIAVALPPPKPPTPPTASAATSPHAVIGLKQGATGQAVRTWQHWLREDGFADIPKDSDTFGPQTHLYTTQLQADRGLPQDGIVSQALYNAYPLPPLLGKRVLSQGSRGGAVKAWQRVLVAGGQTALVVDGVFEGETVTGTKYWQSKRGLEADGKVGEKTVAAIGLKTLVTSAAPAIVAAVPAVATAVVQAAVKELYSTTFDHTKWRANMKRGDQGHDVAEWQTILSRDGFVSYPDGIFGAETETSTKAWQKARKLDPDGKVGPATRAAIVVNPARVSGYDLAVETEGVPRGAFVPVAPLPGMTPQVPSEVVAPERALASKLALHLFFAQPGDEDRNLVQLFQSVNGLNTTGSYGPGTAECLIGYGIIPPSPRAWPSKGALQARARYRAALKAQAHRDPQRAHEWNSAAVSVGQRMLGRRR